MPTCAVPTSASSLGVECRAPSGGTVTLRNVDLLQSGASAVYGPDDRHLGTVEQVFGDPDTGEPQLLMMATDTRGLGVLVPLAGARIDGTDLVIAYTDSQLRDAPTMVADGDLTPADAARTHEHYPGRW
jgi:hypothetical protein